MKNRIFTLTVLLLLSVTNLTNAQNNYADWANAGKPDLTFGQPNTINAPLGTLTTYPDLATFQAAAPTVVFEDFNGGLIGAMTAFGQCTPPVNSLSNDACFTPGDLIAGFNIEPSTLGNDIVALGDGFIGNATTILGAITFTDDTNLIFNSAVDAVAFDVTTNGANPITITAFDAGSVVIGTINTAVTAQGALTFVGFSSSTPIASITVSDDTGGGELIDNLGFGSLAPLAPPAPIPTLSTTSLLLLLLTLLSITMLTFRKVKD